jgi:predicted metal-binding protein
LARVVNLKNQVEEKQIMGKIRARRIKLDTPEKILKKDLDLYQEKSLQLGATDARIISARQVVVDPRVRLKCLVPRCHLYGETPNCPPYTPELHQMRRILEKYNYAILVKNDVLPAEDFVDDEKWYKAHMAHQAKTHHIVSGVEALAFNDGYYFAAGFAAGGCKTALCGGRICQFLDSGRCRFPLKARPSMEAVGIDVYRLVSLVGWEIYPVAHKDVDPQSIPCAISVGIVFVA